MEEQRRRDVAYIWLLCVLWQAAAAALNQSEFILKLNNTSPAATYSNVTFAAFLQHKDGSYVNKELYKYKWEEKTFFTQHLESYGDMSSNISVWLHGITIRAKTYDMEVTVFKKIDPESSKWEGNEEKVISGTMNFTLTSTLNGNFSVSQHRNITTAPDYYVAKQNITLNASISDVFTNASMMYIWHLGSAKNSLITHHPVINISLPNARSSYTVGATVVATFTDYVLGIPLEMNMTADFNETIKVRDAIVGLSYSGDSTIKQGAMIGALVTCKGSPPFNFTWWLSDPKNETVTFSVSQEDKNCSLNLTSAAVKLEKAGNYSLHVVTRNDVSEEGLMVAISVPVTVSSAIPVLCAAIGITVLLGIVYAYRRDVTPRETTETANFDFHQYSARARTFYEYLKQVVQRKREAQYTPTVVSDLSRSESMPARFERSNSYGSITSGMI